MAFAMSRVDRMFREYDVTAALPDGSPVAVTGVDVALLPPRATPTADTVWTATEVTAGVATVLLAGPEADDTDALAVPAAGADLWLRLTDIPEVLAVRVERVTAT